MLSLSNPFEEHEGVGAASELNELSPDVFLQGAPGERRSSCQFCGGPVRDIPDGNGFCHAMNLLQAAA